MSFRSMVLVGMICSGVWISSAEAQSYTQLASQSFAGEASQLFWKGYQNKSGEWTRFVGDYQKPENRERINRDLAGYNSKAGDFLRGRNINVSFAAGTPEIEKTLVLMPLVNEYVNKKKLDRAVAFTYVTSPARQAELAAALGMSKEDLGFDGTATAVFSRGFTVRKDFSESFKPELEYVFDRPVKYVVNGNAITVIDPRVAHFPAGIPNVQEGDRVTPAPGSSMRLYNVGIKGLNGTTLEGKSVELLANLPENTMPILQSTMHPDHVKYSVYYGADRYSFTSSDSMLVLYKDNEMRATPDVSFRDAAIEQVFITNPENVNSVVQKLSIRKEKMGMVTPDALEELLDLPGMKLNSCTTA